MEGKEISSKTRGPIPSGGILQSIYEDPSHLQKQPTMNIGMIGHVAHGKSSFVRAVSGITTGTHSKEQIRNCTLQLGYANFKIFQCNNLMCQPPECYQSHGGSVNACKCKSCGSDTTLVRHISFVDCPGHEMLMRTMLNGAAVMDAAILVVAANERVPQPQTVEHLVATEIMHLRNIITVQSKIDLVTLEQAMQNKAEIDTMLKDTVALNSPIIPVSCTPKLAANVDVLLQYLVEKIPQPVRDLKAPPCMKVIRSFDINKPGTAWSSLKGGVCGGSIECGVLNVGDQIEIRPGLIIASASGKSYTPLFTRVTGLFSESKALDIALPGGLIAVGTLLDPVLTGKNKLVGNVLGRVGCLPEVYIAMEMRFKLLRIVVGDESGLKVRSPAVSEEVLLTVGSASVRGHISSVALTKSRSGTLVVALADPVCASIGENVSISRRIKNRFRLIGWCTVLKGKKAVLNSSQ